MQKLMKSVFVVQPSSQKERKSAWQQLSLRFQNLLGIWLHTAYGQPCSGGWEKFLNIHQEGMIFNFHEEVVVGLKNDDRGARQSPTAAAARGQLQASFAAMRRGVHKTKRLSPLPGHVRAAVVTGSGIRRKG